MVTGTLLPTVRLLPEIETTPSAPNAETVSVPDGVLAVTVSPAVVRSMPVGTSVSESGAELTQMLEGTPSTPNAVAMLGSASVVDELEQGPVQETATC
jgi:hypothetical protein